MKEYRTGSISVIENEHPWEGKKPDFLSGEATAAAHRIHRELPGYQMTPLRRLQGMAKQLGIREMLVKDESGRFGLKAFKGLGGLYALTCVICQKLNLDLNEVSFETLKSPACEAAIRSMVFVTATDGNHGKGLSWAAGQLGCAVHVYMPAGSSELRAQAIREVNSRAEVRILETGYDDTVRYAARMADMHGWVLVQDTSWTGYEEIPSRIIQGYTTMAYEACIQLKELRLRPTHVFLQAGVGAMAGGVLGYFVNVWKAPRPRVIVVEPEHMACIYESARIGDGAPHEAKNQQPTIMAGLSCGEPCTITWPILRDFADWYVTCPDAVSEYGMRRLAHPEAGDPPVISGESGAVTTGLVHAIAGRPEYAALKERLGLDENAVVLCFSTEGDTDPVHYRAVAEGKEENLCFK